MASLPLVANRQTPSIESRENYNVKKRGLRWVTVEKSWKVNADKVVESSSQDDSVLYDHIRKKSWTHNQYFPRHQSKVNKNWRPWKFDLDREQYNHLHIPVNHSISWMAPTFIRRADKEQHQLDTEQKFINDEYKPCNLQAIPVDKKRKTEPFIFTGSETTLVDDIIGRSKVSAGVFEKRMTTNDFVTPIGAILEDKPVISLKTNPKGSFTKQNNENVTPIGMILEDKPVISLKTNPKGSFTKHNEIVVKELCENKPTISLQETIKDVRRQPFVERKQVQLVDKTPVLISPNLFDKVHRKNQNEYDVTTQTQKKLLETTIQALVHKNVHEGYHPSFELKHRPQDDVDMFEVRVARPTFDRHTPTFHAIKT